MLEPSCGVDVTQQPAASRIDFTGYNGFVSGATNSWVKHLFGVLQPRCDENGDGGITTEGSSMRTRVRSSHKGESFKASLQRQARVWMLTHFPVT